MTLSGAGALYLELSLPCEAQSEPAFCRQREEGLRVVGVPKGFYVSSMTLGVLVELLPWFIAGGLIFWQKSREWFGYVFSLTMMLQGITAIDPAIAQWAAFVYPGAQWVVDGIGFIGLSMMAAWYFFPDGRLGLRWKGILAAIWILRVVGITFFPGTPLDSSA